MTKPLRILFAGTPEFAATSLASVIAGPHELVGVYTQPDRPAGRGQKLMASPVKKLAMAHDIPVFQPVSLRQAEAQQELASLNADLMIVVAYGLILPQAVLDTPRLGCINVHASLLPRWRGAAPIHRALLSGDGETGVTIMQMEAGLDTGPMLYTLTTPIDGKETSGMLHDRLASLGAEALGVVLNQLAQGPMKGEIQDDSLATYAHKLEKQEGSIDWHKNATEIDRQIRGLHPWPIAYTDLGDMRIRVHAARLAPGKAGAAAGSILSAGKEGILVASGDGRALALTTLQLPGSRAMSCADILNGKAELFAPGQVFTQEAEA
ncbi:methionyl-tRNA formyltransferase [Pokkaliibacter sp. CJK22405]|uniref:methionyl-tRNA formyltransferase n=1 Tax=Pokkaliibacter sp. CJK22405 TaxID=3384615 RepID=UPI003984F381